MRLAARSSWWVATCFALALFAHPRVGHAVNPGFETALVCPDTAIEPFDGYVAEWFKATVGTPNYYHACATDAQ